MRLLAVLCLVSALAVGGAYLIAGRAAGPRIEIRQPGPMVGLASALEVSVEAPGGRFSRIDARVEQGGRQIPLFSLTGALDATLTQETADRVRLTRPIGKQSVPGLGPGPARIVVDAARPVLYGLRTIEAAAVRDVHVRFDPPRLSVLSTHHYINHGGSEMVVYRVTPHDAESGVRVGDLTYPGYPAAGAGINGDPSLRVAFFALLHDQDRATPIGLYARDAAGNQAGAPLDSRVFEKTFKRSRIDLNEGFLRRVVPAIMQHTPTLQMSVDKPADLLPAFLRINGELRQRNADEIRSFAARTSAEMRWQGPFQQLGHSQVESAFADHRTYYYGGREVDQQVHLGFDLASTAAVPVVAANRGTVVYTGHLGIYGQSVVLDHGMGVQSLYAHLSATDVEPDEDVDKNQRIGRSGMTGLAGGDHLHFTMLVNGHPVNPVEWWDPHWIEDRVLRKIRDSGLGIRDQGSSPILNPQLSGC